MHKCPHCGNSCTCNAESFYGPNGLTVMCNHCKPLEDHEFEEPGPVQKRSLIDRLPKWLKIADSIVSILVQFICYVYAIRLLVVGDMYRGMVLLAVATVLGLLMHAISKL